MQVTTVLGTEMRMYLAGREARTDTGFLRGRNIFGNLSAGETYIAPIEDSAEGLLVVNKCFPGISLSEPVQMTFKKGRVIYFEGGAGANFLEKAIAQLEAINSTPNLDLIAISFGASSNLNGFALR